MAPILHYPCSNSKSCELNYKKSSVSPQPSLHGLSDQSSPTPSVHPASTGDKRSLDLMELQADPGVNPLNYHKRKKNPDDAIKEHNHWGHILGRLYDTYNSPSTIITSGLTLEQSDNQSEFSGDSFELVTHHIPRIDMFLSSPHADAGTIRCMAHEMKQGQDDAHSNDMATLKKGIIEMLHIFDMLHVFDHDKSKGLEARNKAN
ncbi:hypothetical protein JB92DRAFT_3130055 [Gautieria morchelliformis]|nr:hypothetical protein JB92DRAFT_3130055 [Gautieria morchelliformis]